MSTPLTFLKLQFTNLSHRSTTSYNMFKCIFFSGAPAENDELKKITEAHDPNRTDAVDYSIFLTGKKFINKVQYMKVHQVWF